MREYICLILTTYYIDMCIHTHSSIMLTCAHIIFLHSTNIEEIIKYTNQCFG